MPSLQARLRELAAFNKGLCVITTRLRIADLADHAGTSALRLDLEQLSSDAGAQLLRALSVKEDATELRRGSDEFSGHCLAPTLLGSHLADRFNGDIRFREEVSARLGHDVRQGSTGNPHPKGHGILPDLVWRGSRAVRAPHLGSV